LAYEAALLVAQPGSLWPAHRAGYQGNQEFLSHADVVLIARLAAFAMFAFSLDAARPTPKLHRRTSRRFGA